MKKNNITQVPPNIWNEPYITLTRGELVRRFDEYNRLYFDNVLPPCRINMTKEEGCRGSYVAPSQNDTRIYIPKYAFWTDTSLKLVLIHEMCHHYVHTFYLSRWDYHIFHHGKKFNKVCKMLKKKYGLRVKVTELPTVYYYHEKIPTTFLGRLWRKYLWVRF